MNRSTEPISVVLIALYRYQNFPVRIMHSLLENIDGVQPYSIFLKNFYTTAIKPPTSREEMLLRELIIELNPKIVGISVYSPFVSTAKRISKIVKSESSALLVWGGIHPTLSPETSKNLGRYSRRRSVHNIMHEMKEILSVPGNNKEMVEFHV